MLANDALCNKFNNKDTVTQIATPTHVYKEIQNAWELMMKYQQYPIGNRGMAAFFGLELCQFINNFRTLVVKDASVPELIENIETVFSKLKISAEYFSPDNKKYLLASIASLLSSITSYTFSKNKFDGFSNLVSQAEAFALWGTGRCNNVACTMFLLLGSTGISPIEIVSLTAPSGETGHCLLLVGRNEDSNIQNIYDTDVLVVDYWSGCIGKACDLFNDQLASFKNRPIKTCAVFNEGQLPLPQFAFPDMSHTDEVRDIVNSFYNAFMQCMIKKAQKLFSTKPDLLFLKTKYDRKSSKINYTEKDSIYLQSGDAYDAARISNISKFRMTLK